MILKRFQNIILNGLLIQTGTLETGLSIRYTLELNDGQVDIDTEIIDTRVDSR